MVIELEIDFVADLSANCLVPGGAILGEADFLGYGVAGKGVVRRVFGNGADADSDVTGVLVATGDFSVHGRVADGRTFASSDLVAELVAAVLADAVVLEEGRAQDILEAEGLLADELYLAPVFAVQSVLSEDVAGDGVFLSESLGEVERDTGVYSAEVGTETTVVMDVESDSIFFGCEGDVDLLDALAV